MFFNSKEVFLTWRQRVFHLAGRSFFTWEETKTSWRGVFFTGREVLFILRETQNSRK